MKIIQILHHSLSPFNMGVDVRFYEEDWHVKVAKEIIKRTNKYELECWRPETTFKKIYTREKDGIIYKIFPSLYLDFPREYSLSMFRALKKQCKGEEVLIHIQGIHNDLAYLICLLFKDVPIVGSHLGGSPYTYSHRGFIYHLPMSIMERTALRSMDNIFVGSKYVAKVLYKLNSGVILYPAVGVDFEKCKPLKKEEARKMLNLPPHKKLMLHVGRFNSAKGLDIILDAYQKLKKKYDVELLVIGGQKTEPLYRKVVESGVFVIERVPHDELVAYYSAADVYLFPWFGKNRRAEKQSMFGGIGVATMESLACGTPVVGTTNLKSFLGDNGELEQVGKIPKDPSDVIQCISEILEDSTHYRTCREIAMKYYDWETIIKHHIDAYDELFKKYYI